MTEQDTTLKPENTNIEIWRDGVKITSFAANRTNAAEIVASYERCEVKYVPMDEAEQMGAGLNLWPRNMGRRKCIKHS